MQAMMQVEYYDEINNVGDFSDINTTTLVEWESWSNYWYNNDESFQRKLQEKRQSIAAVDELNAPALEAAAQRDFENEVVRFFKEKVEEYDTFFRKRSTAKDKAKVDMDNEYGNNSRYSEELATRAYMSVSGMEGGGSGGTGIVLD